MPATAQACRTHDFTDVVVIQETRGQPDGLLVCHLPLGPTAYFTLSNVVMRHDIEDRGTISEAYPHIILEGFTSALGTSTVLFVPSLLKHIHGSRDAAIRGGLTARLVYLVFLLCSV